MRTVLLTAIAIGGGLTVELWAETPQVALDLLDTAERHREDGRVELAIEAYRRALDADPSLVAAHAALGALYHEQGRFDDAYASFTRGIEQAPDDRSLLFNAAVLALRLDRVEEALEWVERALAQAAGDVELLSLKSAVLQRLDRSEEALEALLRAAEERSKDAQIWFRLGNLQHQLGQIAEAAESFRKAVRFDRKLLRAYYNLGAVLFELGQDDEALRAYEVALEPIDKALASGEPVESLHARAYANLGAIHLRKRDWEAAASAYGKARRLDPEQKSILYNQGFVLYQAGRRQEARDAYLEALRQGTELPAEAYLQLAQMDADEGHHEDVLRWLDRGRSGLTNDADRLLAAHLVARAHDALGQTAEAELAWRQALELSPRDRTAGLGLGRLLRQSGRQDEAREILGTVRQGERDVTVDLELARIARAAGDREAERRLYESLLSGADAAARRRPEFRAVQFNLVLTLLQDGDHAAARRWLDPLLSGKKRNEARGLEAWLLETVHGLLLAAEGNVAESRRRLASVADSVSSSDFRPAAEALALLDLSRGQVEKALPILRSQAAPNVATAISATEQVNLGQALWLAGQRNEARSLLETALKDLPHHLSGRVVLAHLAFEEGDLAAAISAYESARSLCAETSTRTDSPPGSGDSSRFEIQLGAGRESRRALCSNVETNLAAALARRAHDRLRAGDRAAVSDAENVLRLSPSPPVRALAHFVRGTVRALDREWRGAEQDLERAVDGELTAALRPLARGNLVAVLLQLGDVDGARNRLGTSAGESPAERLNRAILRDRAGSSDAALELYGSVLDDLSAPDDQPARDEIAARFELIGKFY